MPVKIDLDARTAILETKVDNIEHRCVAHHEQFRELRQGVNDISTHIAKQNGALPRIEKYTEQAAKRLDQFESILFTYAIEDKEEAIETAKATATQKIIWGAGLVLVGAILTEVIRYFLTALLG